MKLTIHAFFPPLLEASRSRLFFPLSQCLGDDGAASIKGAALNKKIQYEKEWDIRHHEGIAEPQLSPSLEAVI